MRTALVTGANRGIGEAIAHGLADQGLRVLVGSRVLADGEAVAKAIVEKGHKARAFEIDVSTSASISDALEALASDGETVDVLINNAGVLDDAPLLELSDEATVQHVDVNALAPLRLTRALAPGMAKRGYGRIVNLSSGWGALETLGPGAYGVTKAFLNAITIKLAGELPASVKINAMCPGWVRTRMGGDSASRSAEEGADTAVWLGTLPADGPTGRFFRDRKPISWLDG